MLPHLVEGAQVVGALFPATDAAGRTGDYVSLKNCSKAFVVIAITQGAANTIALTIEKATAAAGTGSTAITKNARIWANQDAVASDALVRQADAVSFTTDAALKNKIVVFEIDPASLGDGYTCITVKTGASNVANITSAMYVLMGQRYPQATVPSAITD